MMTLPPVRVDSELNNCKKYREICTLGRPGIACYKGPSAEGTFTLNLVSDPPATNYSNTATFPQGAIFEATRNYLQTFDDEVYVPFLEIPATNFW